MSLISLKEVVKIYGSGQNEVKALGPVSIEIEEKTFTVVLGRSGSGKSTMLNLLTGLDKISSGELVVLDNDLSLANSRDLANYRSNIGIIFQSYNLLPNLNTIENVMMGAWAGGKEVDEKEVKELLNRFGLSHRTEANIKTLSGGEKQRVAICRSLVAKPKILFCDEPTGALDTKNEDQVRDALLKLNKEDEITVFMVTHNPDFAHFADTVIEMEDGLIKEIKTKQENFKPTQDSINL
jgi:putative ABC transport system ATP-binding protein